MESAIDDIPKGRGYYYGDDIALIIMIILIFIYNDLKFGKGEELGRCDKEVEQATFITELGVRSCQLS